LPRTTIDIDTSVLRALKQIQRRQGKPLGRIVSELLAVALAQKPDAAVPPGGPFRWTSQRMGARVDVADAEAVRIALERE
jgi:hypothetical protein